MHIFKTSTIGTFHTNHNEDAYAITELDPDTVLLAVMDGCSMGTESHFASTLFAKILRKIGKEKSYQAFATGQRKSPIIYLKEVLQQFFVELNQLQHWLHLEREELLSTLILGVFQKSSKRAELITIGDGLICCNGTLHEYEQDNHPDYLGYHLSKPFEEWYADQKQRLSLSAVHDLSLSTDGIFTFQQVDNEWYESISTSEIIHYLLIDQGWTNQELMLHQKQIRLKQQYGILPTDDLTVLRVVL